MDMNQLLKEKFSNYFSLLNNMNNKSSVNLNSEIIKTQNQLKFSKFIFIKEKQNQMFNFQIICNDKTFNINRLILMSNSLFFKNLINSELIESKDNKFTIDKKFANLINKIINFLNKDYFENSASDIFELLDISHYFMIDNLTVLIESELEKFISKNKILRRPYECLVFTRSITKLLSLLSKKKLYLLFDVKLQ